MTTAEISTGSTKLLMTLHIPQVGTEQQPNWYYWGWCRENINSYMNVC